MRIISAKSKVIELYPQILQDESHFSSGVPDSIYFPENIADLQSVLKEAYRSNKPVVFVGAQTGTTGGAVPDDGCIAICFSAMNKIHSIKWDGIYPVLYCDPGVTLSTINSFLKSPESWPYKVEGIDHLQNCRFIYPPDPTEDTAQIGGNVATNASGARSFRFGPTRSFINHISCVLASGELLELSRGEVISDENGFKIRTDQGRLLEIPSPSYRRPVLKNVSGYFSEPDMDLIDLIIGSEGTLVAIGEIGLRLYPSINIISGLSFFESNDTAFDFADFLRQDSQVASIEFFDDSVQSFLHKHAKRSSGQLIQYPPGKKHAIFWEFIENHPESFDSRFELWEKKLSQCGSSFEHTLSGFDQPAQNRLRKFRHTIPELINAVVASHKINFPSIRKIGTDSALPKHLFRSVYSEYLSIINRHSLNFVSFGHLGDYHMHINLIPSNDTELQSALEAYREIMEITIRNGGTISAEHGIGRVKKQYFYQMYNHEEIQQMKKIKAVFDPKGIINPNNLF